MTTRRREQPLNTEPPRASRIAAKVADEIQRLFYTFNFLTLRVSILDGDVSTKIPISLRVLALLLRAIFLGALIAIAVRVSLPQSVGTIVIVMVFAIVLSHSFMLSK